MTGWSKARKQLLLTFILGHVILGLAYLAIRNNAEYLVFFMCLLSLSISLGAIRSFFPIVLGAIRNDKLDGSDLLAIGSVAKSVSLAILSGWVIAYWLITEDVPILRESPVLVYCLFLASFGGMLYMTSEGALPGYIPRHEWTRAGKWIAVGVFLFGVLGFFLKTH